MKRLAVLLAVVAVLGVVATTAVTVSAYVGRTPVAAPVSPGPSISPSPSSTPVELVFKGGQVVYGDREDNALFEVPAKADGWTRSGSGTTLYYVDKKGDPFVGVNGAALFRDDYCPKAKYGSNRAFVGFTRSATGMTPREANTRLARDWVTAVRLDDDQKTSYPATPIRTTAYTLGDGSPAIRSTSTITVPDPDVCVSKRAELTVLSFDSGDNIADLVMVRDLEGDGILPDRTAEQILQTARQQLR